MDNRSALQAAKIMSIAKNHIPTSYIKLYYKHFQNLGVNFKWGRANISAKANIWKEATVIL
eukprot:13513042-Ditylum_brightwellii.AAC.1